VLNLTGLVIAMAVAVHATGLAQTPAAEIEALTKQYEQALNKADAAAVAAFYTNDAIRLAPDGQLLSGRQAVEQNYAASFAGPLKGAKFTLRPGRTQPVTADVVVFEGTYEATGASVVVKGRYVNTAKREGGQWRLASVVAVPEGQSPPSATPKSGREF
jgi:uncharacterized protein (TIGR02246 family)